MRSISIFALISAIVAVLLSFSAPSEAANYQGRGDTKDTPYARKQDCCDAAILAAQEDSARACRSVGGFAQVQPGVASGRCKWKTRQPPGGTRYYWCTATATVRCR